MKTIHRHISEGFLVTFVMTLLVFTFVMCIGVMFKAGDLLARGVAWGPVFRIILCGLPSILSFSIPISVMTSSLLVFGRLSSDGEITAMKACGMSMWQIASRPLMFGILLSVICLYINSELSPKSHYARKTLKTALGVESPLEILDEGRFIRDYAGYTIYLGSKKDNRIENIRIHDTASEVHREIVARSGTMGPDESGTDLVLMLYDVRLDPFSSGNSDAGYCDSYKMIIPDVIKTARYDKRDEDLMLGELWARSAWPDNFYPDLNAEERRIMRMSLLTEFNKRVVLGVSCAAFMLLGIPLGVKSHRKESSIGIALGMFLFFTFYLFIMMAEELSGRPELRPDIIVWVPVVISIILGATLIRRVS